MRDAPSISVLVPVWNAAADDGRRLRTAFESLFAQCGTPQAPLPPLEILAVDDQGRSARQICRIELVP